MKRFRCGDVVPGCTTAFVGTESDVLVQVAAHAAAAHGLTDVPPALVEQVRSAMVDA